MNKPRPLFAVLGLALLMMLTRVAYVLTSKFSSYEIFIPRKLEPRDGKEIKGYLSYAIEIEGKEHIVHLTQNRRVLSKEFTLFTYNSKGELHMEQPFIRDDCYYQGSLEGIQDSLVAVSTCSGLRGLLQVNAVNYEIQPAESSSTLQHLLYQIEDLGIEDNICGVKRQGESPRMDELNPLRYRSINILREKRRYVEMFVVVDYERYEASKKNSSLVRTDMENLINIVDSMYDALNTDVILVGLEIWTERNQIDIEGTDATTLDRFRLWKVEHLDPRFMCDLAFLILKRGYGRVSGKAYLGTMCSKEYSVAFAAYKYNVPILAVTFAHELGHTLDIDHDEAHCVCPVHACIMNDRTAKTSTFSDCSIDYYANFIKKGQADCLLNKPKVDTTEPPPTSGSCGDEENKECDCGSEEECKKDPCCDIKCKLKPGAECSTGMCCKRCKFMKKGKPCRIPVSECDLAEYCSGISATCPPDFYSQDGTPCNNGQSVCCKNICYDFNRHCQQMFGQGAKSASLECFTAVNTIGDRFGNCGNVENKMKKCESNSAKCGRAQCVNVKKISPSDNNSSILQTPMGKSWCWGLDYKLHTNTPDFGRVPDGARCDPGKICLSGRCVTETVLKYDCDVNMKCGGHGVCNNEKNCHCNNGWAPPNCMKQGYGGSIDSGPLVKDSFISYIYPEEGPSISLTLITSLTVLLAIGILILAIVAYVKKNELKRFLTIIWERISSATRNAMCK